MVSDGQQNPSHHFCIPGSRMGTFQSPRYFCAFSCLMLGFMAVLGCLGVGKQAPVGALAMREEQGCWAACRGEGIVGARHTSGLQLMVLVDAVDGV